MPLTNTSLFPTDFAVNKACSWERSNTSVQHPLLGAVVGYLFKAPDFVLQLQSHIVPAFALIQPSFFSSRIITDLAFVLLDPSKLKRALLRDSSINEPEFWQRLRALASVCSLSINFFCHQATKHRRLVSVGLRLSARSIRPLPWREPFSTIPVQTHAFSKLHACPYPTCRDVTDGMQAPWKLPVDVASKNCVCLTSACLEVPVESCFIDDFSRF